VTRADITTTIAQEPTTHKACRGYPLRSPKNPRHTKRVVATRFQDVEDFRLALKPHKPFGARVGLAKLQDTNGRLRNHFLPRDLRALYDFLTADSRVCRLGELAQVGIGYVTGNNEFFHLSNEQARELEIPHLYLKRSLLRSGMTTPVPSPSPPKSTDCPPPGSFSSRTRCPLRS
jgi:hypothetical protein